MVVAIATAALLQLPSARPGTSGEAAIRRALTAAGGAIDLPAGVVEISGELLIPAGAHDLEIRGAPAGTTLRATDHFHGRAIFQCERARHVGFSGFIIDGNRSAIERRTGLPGFSTPFARSTMGNGI